MGEYNPPPRGDNPVEVDVSLQGYTNVTVKRAVQVDGFWYKPNFIHTVDANTLGKLGDAVATSHPAG